MHPDSAPSSGLKDCERSLPHSDRPERRIILRLNDAHAGGKRFAESCTRRSLPSRNVRYLHWSSFGVPCSNARQIPATHHAIEQFVTDTAVAAHALTALAKRQFVRIVQHHSSSRVVACYKVC